ncbi:MAG TPA: SAM-dependent chlorinase/fluorinase [bacterium]
MRAGGHDRARPRRRLPRAVRRPAAPLVALLSDFGTRDWYAAAMKAVILARCPAAQLLDITHDVPPQDIVAGALALAGAASWCPDGTIFVGVVDPGVGTVRPLVAVETQRHRFLGPDNGLLAPAAEADGVRRIVRLTNPRYWLPRVARTFHGRDILAPVAAYLASGGALGRLGPRADAMEPLALPRTSVRGRRALGMVVHVDRFGNAITNLAGGDRAAQVRVGRREARWVRSYASGRPGELIALTGSLGMIELSEQGGSAADRFGIRRGVPVEVEWAREGS